MQLKVQLNPPFATRLNPFYEHLDEKNTVLQRSKIGRKNPSPDYFFFVLRTNTLLTPTQILTTNTISIMQRPSDH